MLRRMVLIELHYPSPTPIILTDHPKSQRAGPTEGLPPNRARIAASDCLERGPTPGNSSDAVSMAYFRFGPLPVEEAAPSPSSLLTVRQERRSLDQPPVTNRRNLRATSCGLIVGRPSFSSEPGRDPHVDEGRPFGGEGGVEAGEAVAARRKAIT